MALLLAIVTLEQLRSAECKVACGYTGYDGGIFWKNSCYCFDVKDYSELTNKKIIFLPKKSKAPAGLSSYEEPKITPQSQQSTWRYRGYPKEEDIYE
jgi:hypothetical protein